jgi:hypothetical protein
LGKLRVLSVPPLRPLFVVAALSGSAVISLGPGAAARAAVVSITRLPAGGIQPQIAVDGNGTAHVVYFKGEAGTGDLYYSTFTDDGPWSTPVRVNSESGSAIATGTVRGAQIAIGRGGRVHISWNGSSRVTPKAQAGATPLLYARLDPKQRVFEPQRNLIQFATGLDGGGAIAADSGGRIFVAWHAGGPDSKGEGDRRVWLATSTDDGATFGKERAISDASTGACGCCGMDALIDRRGSISFLYRSAREVFNRDTYLLRSTDSGRTFSSTKLQAWNLGACPMSTFSLAEHADGVVAAWETAGQVQFSRVSAGGVVSRRTEAPGLERARRHPSLAVNSSGDVLLAWSEGTAWQRGGSAAWQVFDKADRTTADSGRAAGVPVWGLVAAFARRDGNFTIVY